MTQDLFDFLKQHAPSSTNQAGETLYSLPMYLFRKPLGWPGDENWWLYKQLNKQYKKGGDT